MSTRVVLVDDQEPIRAGLAMVIAGLPDLEVVGEAGTGTRAVEPAAQLRPDMRVMDIRMPDMDGIEATRIITAECPATRVLVPTTFDDDENVYGALRAGAAGFLVKDMALVDILAAIRVVADGDGLIERSVTRRLIAEFAGRPDPAGAPGRAARPGPALSG
ncbi:response regulator transcription factor, partial [Streptomyces sp. SID3343]|uniref:response regulator n=1 Tax=Streptomyces sp. SID3343 TaxID=2690260 RepID=UPI001370BF43|nr:response regulator [Streptomyces sp. SID3343]